jgi:hypothetical protein
MLRLTLLLRLGVTIGTVTLSLSLLFWMLVVDSRFFFIIDKINFLLFYKIFFIVVPLSK